MWLENVSVQGKLLWQRSGDVQGEFCIGDVRGPALLLLLRHVVPRKQPHPWGQML